MKDVIDLTDSPPPRESKKRRPAAVEHGPQHAGGGQQALIQRVLLLLPHADREVVARALECHKALGEEAALEAVVNELLSSSDGTSGGDGARPAAEGGAPMTDAQLAAQLAALEAGKQQAVDRALACSLAAQNQSAHASVPSARSSPFPLETSSLQQETGKTEGILAALLACLEAAATPDYDAYVCVDVAMYEGQWDKGDDLFSLAIFFPGLIRDHVFLFVTLYFDRRVGP